MYQSKYFISSTLSENLKPETWYERLNLFGKLKRFCQYCTGTFIFWLAVGITTLAEPVLCSRKPDPQVIFMQVILLGISSALYVIQLIGVASREWMGQNSDDPSIIDELYLPHNTSHKFYSPEALHILYGGG